MHNRRMFVKKLNDGMNSFAKGIRQVVKNISEGISRMLDTRTLSETQEVANVYTNIHAPKGIVQVIPSSFANKLQG